MAGILATQNTTIKPEAKRVFGYLPDINEGLNNPAMPRRPRLDPSKVIGGIPGTFDENKPFSLVSGASIGILDRDINPSTLFAETAVSAGDEVKVLTTKAVEATMEQVLRAGKEGVTILEKGFSVFAHEASAQIMGTPQAEQHREASPEEEQQAAARKVLEKNMQMNRAVETQVQQRVTGETEHDFAEIGGAPSQDEANKLLKVSRSLLRKRDYTPYERLEIVKNFKQQEQEIDEPTMDTGGGSYRAKDAQAGLDINKELVNSKDIHAGAHGAG